jgi:hypothetical protein
VDLTARLATWATTRTAVLLVEVPGWAATRWAAEREMRRRGWRSADSPADADVLLVCGAPGDRLSTACDVAWSQLPGPRARAAADDRTDVRAALDGALATLHDERRQRDDAAGRPSDPVTGPTAAPADEDDGPEDDMHHDDMEMAPGGIPLAGSGGADRDGLEMDVLSVPLGPVLPHWPAGLVLRCTLAGDVVVAARADVLGAAEGARPPSPSPSAFAAARLDRAAQLLTLAGRGADAATAVRLRDAVLADDAGAADGLERFRRHVRRSRLARWALGGTGSVDAGEHDLPAWVAGTVHDRLMTMLDQAQPAGHGSAMQPPGTPVDRLPALVDGLEIGAVRMLVTSLDVQTAPLPSAVDAG